MSIPVTITGTARLKALVDWEGKGEFELDFDLVPYSEAIIVESHTLFMAQGGYVLDVKDEDHKLFDKGPELKAITAINYPYGPRQALSLIVVHTSARFSAPGDSTSIVRHNLQQFSVSGDANTTWASGVETKPLGFLTSGPPRFPGAGTEHGLMIGLMGPVEVMDLVEAKRNVNVVRRTLNLSGHFINLFRDERFAAFLANPQKDSLDRWHVTVRDHGSGQIVVDQDLPIPMDNNWDGFYQNKIFGRDPDGRFGIFHYALRVPDDFTFGLLQLELRCKSMNTDGAEIMMEAFYETEVQLAPVDVLHLPLNPTDPLFRDAQINFGNGPAEPLSDPQVKSNSHNGSMLMRYAYDLGVYVNGSELRPGQEGTLGAYWIFGAPIFSIADGTVIRVEVESRDAMPTDPVRFAYEFLGDPGGTNRVVVRHDHAEKPRYSVYAHCRFHSATVHVGDRVSAGQKIAEVGCNGQTSGPHLHLAYYEFDDWGGIRMLPMAFTVSDGGTGSITGVPRSNHRLQAPAGSGSVTNRGFWQVVGDFFQEVGTAVGNFVRGLFGGG